MNFYSDHDRGNRICRKQFRIEKHCHSTTPIQKENEKKLRYSSLICNTEMLLRLLKIGTNVNCVDSLSRSSLHVAASRGFVDIIKHLLEHGGDPNLKDVVGNTPLHLAVCSATSKKCSEVVRLLLRYGSNVHSKDRMGKNPLDLAKSKLALMRSRRQNVNSLVPNFDDDCRFIAMTLITTELMHVYKKEQTKLDDMISLENGFQNLTTKDIDNEADILLDKIDKMGIE